MNEMRPTNPSDLERAEAIAPDPVNPKIRTMEVIDTDFHFTPKWDTLKRYLKEPFKSRLYHFPLGSLEYNPEPANEKPGVNPLWPVVTMPPVPIERPSGANTASPVEYDAASGNVCVITGEGCARVSAPNASLNCQLNSATPPGAVEPVASNVIASPPTAVTVSVAVGPSLGSVNRCRQV